MPGRMRLLAAGVAAVTLVAAAPASSAYASTGSSYSAAATVTAGSIAPTVGTSGLLGFLGPVLSGVVNPLTAAVGALPGQVLAGVVGSLTGAGLQASNPATAQTAPASGYPTCGTGGWNSSDCYGPVTPTIALAPLLSLSTGAIQGYATGDASGYTSKAGLADPVISVLAVNIGDLGVVKSKSICTAAGTCTSMQSVASASLLSGLISANVAPGTGLLSLSVAGVPLASGSNTNVALGSLPAGLLGINVALNNNLATITLNIGLTGLLNGLGLGNLLAGVAGLVDGGSSVALTLTLGPGSLAGAGSIQSWGLDLGIDLSANISLSLLGLAGVTITIPTGIAGASHGNVVDLKLAYTNAYAGALSAGPQWIPAGLI